MTLTDDNSQVANCNLSRTYPFKCGTSLALQSRARSNALCLAFFSSSRSRWQSPELPSPTSRVQYFPVSLLSSLTDWNDTAKDLHIYTFSLICLILSWPKISLVTPSKLKLATNKSCIIGSDSSCTVFYLSKVFKKNFTLILVIKKVYPKTVLLARHGRRCFTLFLIVHHNSAWQTPHKGEAPSMALPGLCGAGRQEAAAGPRGLLLGAARGQEPSRRGVHRRLRRQEHLVYECLGWVVDIF